jgi:hypothetical protein
MAEMTTPRRTALAPREDSPKQPGTGTRDPREVLKELEASPSGLSDAEAKARLDKFGPNELPEKEANPLAKFLSCFWGPIPWMIEAAAILKEDDDPIGWSLAGLIWAYSLFWFLVEDRLKLAAYRISTGPDRVCSCGNGTESGGTTGTDRDTGGTAMFSPRPGVMRARRRTARNYDADLAAPSASATRAGASG